VVVLLTPSQDWQSLSAFVALRLSSPVKRAGMASRSVITDAGARGEGKWVAGRLNSREIKPAFCARARRISYNPRVSSRMDADTGLHPSRLTRRRLLKGAAGMAAAAAASLMPPNVRRALAQGQAANGSLRDIKHVVILMQENRSFDHYFGTLAGVRGFEDSNALRLPGGKSVFYQPDAEHPNGYMLPFHLDTHASSAQKIPSTSHAWAVQHEAWNGGLMDRWLPAHRKADGVKGPYVMGYYTRSDIPFHFALAEAFTICDAYHCSLMGPTWPNRMYLMTGMIDPDRTGGGPIINNKAPDGGYEWTTYPERLEKAGVSWKVYQQQDRYGCNMLENVKTFQKAGRGSGLYTRGIQIDPEGQFEHDATNDRLPAVSWIIPTSFQCEHPDYMPADGAAFIASKIDAIAANPDVWAKTVFILNYDENDGLFDHVVPPTPPAGTPHEFVDDVPIGAGFRVPCIIVSPWTSGGWVCSQTFDHTSVLQFLEHFTGVREPNISEWRRKTFGDLGAVFRFGAPAAKPPLLSDTGGPLVVARYGVNTLPKPAFPEGDQRPPQQEKGSRNRI
jgi:phospholipase C